jgi:hypothetical protein
MLSTNDILFGVLLPFVVAGAILKLANLLANGRRWAGPVAIGGAFAAGFGAIEGFKQLFPPASAVPWLFHVGLLFLLVGVFESLVRMPLWLRATVIFLATALGAGLLLRFNFTNHTWDAPQGGLWLAAIAAVGVIWWGCFERSSSERGPIMPLAGMLICGIAGLVVMLIADQTTGQALGALAVALAAAAAVVWWFKDISLARGTAAVIAGVAVCALAAAYFVSDVPILDLALVAIAPVLLVASGWMPMNRARPWLRGLARLAILMVPLGVALALAIAQFQREAAERSADPYSMGPAFPSMSVPDFAAAAPIDQRSRDGSEVERCDRRDVSNRHAAQDIAGEVGIQNVSQDRRRDSQADEGDRRGRIEVREEDAERDRAGAVAGGKTFTLAVVAEAGAEKFAGAIFVRADAAEQSFQDEADDGGGEDGGEHEQGSPAMRRIKLANNERNQRRSDGLAPLGEECGFALDIAFERKLKRGAKAARFEQHHEGAGDEQDE